MREMIVLCCTLSLFGCASGPNSVAKTQQQRYDDDTQLTTFQVQAIEAFCGPGQPGDNCPGARVAVMLSGETGIGKYHPRDQD
ncbi:MAG TPA: hypothetical protein VMW17_03515 [Candidatus Binatia bacterium]|nr:hypothetical protein [Candidatus Binatia bacterium]